MNATPSELLMHNFNEISRPPWIKITQCMEGIVPCTALYLLIRVTFSTPTPFIIN